MILDKNKMFQNHRYGEIRVLNEINTNYMGGVEFLEKVDGTIKNSKHLIN